MPQLLLGRHGVLICGPHHHKSFFAHFRQRQVDCAYVLSSFQILETRPHLNKALALQVDGAQHRSLSPLSTNWPTQAKGQMIFYSRPHIHAYRHLLIEPKPSQNFPSKRGKQYRPRPA